jgi:Transcriptional regulators
MENANQLNQADVVPLYAQLKEILKSSIINGELKPNIKIMSEEELSKKYMISRITVRKAITELVEEGYLIKKQGKGTFVSVPKVNRNIIEFLSFTLTCQINGVKPGSRVIKKEIVEPSATDIRELKLKTDEKVILIQRIRYANGEPLIIENNYFSEHYSELMQENLENRSLYRILKEECGVEPVSSKKTIEICIATKEEANMLQIHQGAALFLMKGTAYDVNGNPVHRAAQLIAGDKFIFSI